MNAQFKLELLGTAQLVSGMILVLLWSFYSSQWCPAALGLLAIFFLIEAIWHYALCDYLRYSKKAD